MSKGKFTASPYHLLSAAQKQARWLRTARRELVRCPHCHTQTVSTELDAHVAQRCPGSPLVRR